MFTPPPVARFRPHLLRVTVLALGPLVLLTRLAAQTASTPSADAGDTIQLSEFTVSAGLDKGYRAGNSVSATRIDTPIKDLPFAVNAFTEQFIADIGARELSDILKYAPSVTSGSDGFNNGNATVNIRGFQTTPQRNGFSSPIFIDGSTIQRVEIVKGPATLFYGQIAPGGVVNYITKRATPKPFTEFNVQLGSYEYARTQVDINQPVVTDRVFFRFNGAWENSSRYVDKTKGEIVLLAPTVAVKVTENSTLNVEYQYYKRDETPQALMRQSARIPLSNPAFFPDPARPGRALYTFDYFGHFIIDDRRYNASSIYDYRNTEVETLTADYEIRHGGSWTTRASFEWEKSDLKLKQTGFGDALVIIPASLLAGLPNDIKVVSQALNASYNLSQATSTQVLRRMRYQNDYGQKRTLQLETTGKLEFGGVTWRPLVGYQYVNADANIFQSALPTALWQPAWDIRNPSTWIDVDAPIGSYVPNNNTLGSSENQGLYSANQFSLLDGRLLAVGGVRWSKAVSQTQNRLNNTLSPEFETTRTTPQAGLGYKVTRDVMIYGNYSESFIAVSSLLRTRGVADRVAQPFLGSGYELGMKVDLLEGRVSGTVAAFDLEQKNYTFNFVEIDPATGITLSTDVQAGNVVGSKGIELELTYSPTDHWQVFVGGSITDTKYTAISSPDVQYLLDTPPQYTARERLNLWTRYSFQDARNTGFWIGGGFNYTGKKAEISNNPFLFLPAQTIVDAVVGYDWKAGNRNWSARLNWKNLTDEDEIQTVRERGEPSRVVVDLSVRF